VTALHVGLRGVWRDLRSGRLAVLTLAVAVAVAAATAVAFFTDRVSRAVDIRSAEVLAADLVLRSNRPIDESHLEEARRLGLETARGVSFPSVVLAGERSALADIEAVTDGYPLRGELRIRDTLVGALRVAGGIPPAGEAWADAKLLARLGVDVGAEISLGATRLSVTAALEYRPDQGLSFVDLAPTLLINAADLAATQLIQPGSRVSYRQLFAGSPRSVDALRRFLRPRLAVSESLRDLRDAGPEIRSAVERADRFLGMAALIGSLLATVAVAMAARRYATRQTDAVALMKCFGVSRSFVLRVLLVQLAAIAIVAGGIGASAGFLAQLGLAALLADFSGGPLPVPGWAPAVGGFVLALTVMAGFALPLLLPLRNVPPLRVLRRDLPGPAPSALLTYGAASAAVLALLYWQVRDPRLTLWLAAGFAGAALVFTGIAAALVWSATRVRGSAGAAWRYAVAGLARRGRDSAVQVTAFGLGIMVLLLLTVVRGDLLRQWQATLPADAPNRFLINIQPDEVARVEAFLGGRLGNEGLVPLVRARLTTINDRPVEALEFPAQRARRLVDREANLSWSDELQSDNELVAGRWWDDAPGSRQVSVERDFAADLGIRLGDRLGFDVAGEQIEATVTSLRSVQWDSFRPNFFMVFAPGVLEDLPRTHIGSMRVEAGERGVILDLVRRFPSVTVIDIDAVIGQVRRVMDQASLAVQYVFLFALVAGVVVLLAVVDAGREERLFECALLRAMGARRSQILAASAIEFGLLGVLSGLLAASGAVAVGWLLADRVFSLELVPGTWLWPVGAAAGVVIVGLSGMLATRRVVDHPPMAVLRQF
jgi:putative ABC transport system permease protein